jgi:hypothetical protein
VERVFFPTVNDAAEPLSWASGAKVALSYENASRSALRRSTYKVFVSANLQNYWKYLRGLARQTLTSPMGETPA